MPKFRVNLEGRTFVVDAPNKESLPEIVDTISASISQTGEQISETAPAVQAQQEQPRRQFVPSPQEFQRFASGSGAPLPSGELFPLEAVSQQIEQRGQLSAQELFNRFRQPGLGSKVIGGLDLIAAPSRAAEAAIANPLLAMQRGRPEEAFEQFRAGVTGQRLGEFGDIMRSTGLFPEAVSAPTGFTAGLIAPVTLINKGIKAIKGVTKGSDAKIIQAGKDLLAGADDAVTKIGAKLEDAYKTVNDALVDPTGIIDDLSELSPRALKFIERELGQTVDTLLDSFTIAKARKLKGLIGEFRPTGFGKEARGVTETVDDKLVSRVFSTIKNNMQKSLENTGFSREAKKLLEADEAFVNTLNASRAMRKAVIDPTTRKPTRAAKVARGLKTEAEATTRLALDQLRRAGGSARKNINKAIRELEKFNRDQAIKKTVEGVTRGALFGGAAGAAGSRLINRGE